MGSNRTLPYQITKEGIEKDLTAEAPQWILSAYGPGKDAPEQLFGGYPREQSMDEIRWHYEKAKAEGKEQVALGEIQSLYENAKQQMDGALRNLDNATKFVVDAANTHPNRLDIVAQGTPSGGTTGEFAVGKRPVGGAQGSAFGSASSSNPFGQPAASSGSGFGQSSAVVVKQNPFGTPAFGQPSQPSTTGSGFGQPSQMGAPGSAFGQPSSMGAKPSPFGGSAFGGSGGSGGTSGFGQASQAGGSAFGQPSQMGSTGSTFGQPSSMGANKSPFGTPAFGQPSQPSTGGGAFGQPSQMGTTTSAFGQPSSMGANKPAPFGSAAGASGGSSPFSGFGGGSSGASPFGQTQQQNQPQTSNVGMGGTGGGSSPFGQKASSPFGAASQPATTSPFGKPSQPATSSPFGQAAQPATSSPFGQPPQPATASPFAAKDSGSTPFGQQQPQPNGFPPAPGTSGAQTSPFGQKPAGFGQPSQSQSPFGQQQQQTTQAPNPFGQQAQQPAPAARLPEGVLANPYPPGSGKQHPSPNEYVDRNAGTWKGQKMEIRGDAIGFWNDRNQWVRIWFSKGPPNYYAETELPDEAYDDKARAQWNAFERTGAFEGGLVPEVPPKRVHCRWDL